jgi:hypothetical protein
LITPWKKKQSYRGFLPVSRQNDAPGRKSAEKLLFLLPTGRSFNGEGSIGETGRLFRKTHFGGVVVNAWGRVVREPDVVGAIDAQEHVGTPPVE